MSGIFLKNSGTFIIFLVPEFGKTYTFSLFCIPIEMNVMELRKEIKICFILSHKILEIVTVTEIFLAKEFEVKCFTFSND